eukprot:31418-Pelagococcus_subviridis.AAC.5
MLFAVGVPPSMRNTSQNTADAGTAAGGSAAFSARHSPTLIAGSAARRIIPTPTAASREHVA